MSLSHSSAVSERVIGLAIDVHRHLGPGLLESAYEQCLSFELVQSGIAHRRQVPLPVVYKEVRLDCGYRMDIVVENELIIEIKSVEQIVPIHEAQMLTYPTPEWSAGGPADELQFSCFKARVTAVRPMSGSPPCSPCLRGYESSAGAAGRF